VGLARIIDVPVWPTRLLVPLFFLVLLAGCTTSAVIILAAWGTATDERSIVAQVDDLLITARIRAGLLMADVGALAALDVFCHQGMVVLAGVVPPGSDLGRRGVEIARAAGGVRQVDTYFVPARESLLRDATAGAEILSLIIGDLDLRAAQVDIGVVDGHAVVTGVVESAAKVDRIVALARTAEGVVGVRSFVQVKSVAAAVPLRPVPRPSPVAATPPPAALVAPPASPLPGVQSE
jgi:osmotically-inducible protein OsmY